MTKPIHDRRTRGFALRLGVVTVLTACVAAAGVSSWAQLQRDRAAPPPAVPEVPGLVADVANEPFRAIPVMTPAPEDCADAVPMTSPEAAAVPNSADANPAPAQTPRARNLPTQRPRSPIASAPSARLPASIGNGATLPHAAVTAQSSADIRDVRAIVLNLREGPSSATSRLGQLRFGETVVVLEHSGRWVRVATPRGMSGWVSSRYLRPRTQITGG